MLVFVRPDKILVLTDGGEYADEVDCDHVKALAFVKTKAEYVWYEDDGMGKDYGRITIEKGGNCVYTGSREKKIEVKLL